MPVLLPRGVREEADEARAVAQPRGGAAAAEPHHERAQVVLQELHLPPREGDGRLGRPRAERIGAGLASRDEQEVRVEAAPGGARAGGQR
jgi:hypothetical protein